MKRTYPANIDGQIFYIDDDAFNLLQCYLDELKQTFKGEEGREIVSDIESRIREHFNTLAEAGVKVIVLADVNNVIATMGRPEELGCATGETETVEAPEAGSAKASSASCPPPAAEQAPFISINLPGKKHLYRNLQNKVFGGVFGGLATYLGWNANIMRILYLALALVTYFWPLTIIYLILWMIIPAAVTPRQRLEMNGTPVNVETVGRAVTDTVTPPPYMENEGGSSFFSTLFNVLGKILMGIFALLVGSLAFAALVCGLALFVGIIGLMCFESTSILTGFNLLPSAVGWSVLASLVLACLFVAITGFSLVYGASSVIFHTKPMSSRTILTIVIIAAVLLITACVCFAIGKPMF